MPNWTYYRLKAPAEVLKQYVSKNDNADINHHPLIFDFNKVIPQPEEYMDPDLISGGDEDFAIYWYLSEKGTKPEEDTPYEYYNKFYTWFGKKIIDSDKMYYPKNDEESKALYERGRKYVSLQDKYGYRDWYDWRRENWGTKWNACECDMRFLDEGDIQFDTAWNPPAPIIQKIFDDNPDCRIGFYWTNEDWDGYHHFIRYKNGRIDRLNCEGVFD